MPAQVLRGSSSWLYIRSHDIIRECDTRTNPTGWEISQQYHENEDQPLVRVQKQVLPLTGTNSAGVNSVNPRGLLQSGRGENRRICKRDTKLSSHSNVELALLRVFFNVNTP